MNKTNYDAKEWEQPKLLTPKNLTVTDRKTYTDFIERLGGTYWYAPSKKILWISIVSK